MRRERFSTRNGLYYPPSRRDSTLQGYRSFGLLNGVFAGLWFFVSFFGSYLDCLKLLMIDDEHYMMKPTPNTLLTYILRYTRLAI